MTKFHSRTELLERWRSIEDEEEDADDDPHKRRRLHQHKEQWFADAYNYLMMGLGEEEEHVWCGSGDLMGPLLETFYNYFKDDRPDSPLRLLWKRVSAQMRVCVPCISHHHQAQHTYRSEYESCSIGPLLDVLQCLDEERVCQHLRDINGRLKMGLYDPLTDNVQVVSLMYEVLMFPVLLVDQSLFTEFECFIEAIDNMHELALAEHQQFPGVYALLFFNRRVRTIGRRLARSMEKLRRETDLEPLQPLLSKFIGFLETGVLPFATWNSRPRVQLERLSIWIGITALLEFLEPPAFEEGIMERYPIFLDVVLNHISGDTEEFSHAVSCLKELFKMLGCKLWLRSSLTPSVMWNTLLGQCFHTRNEKIHKDIFDLFLPFLQSLEALQDGEHEKLRRHFLYFLLHQVPVSSNFNVLTRKLACKIAFLIIHRGYKMNPPSPPFECAHMWGPSLVSCLKDSSLHTSLRQPAVDLVQAIIVSDAAVLVTSLFKHQRTMSVDRSIYVDLNDYKGNDDGSSSALDVEQMDNSCWSEFRTQSENACQESKGWMCIPMLWMDVLVDVDPSVLPVSFSKAVFWARSHLTMVEPETTAEMTLAIRAWLSSSVTEISTSFGWKVPNGLDDGSIGKESKNSIKVSMMHLPLIRIFNRLTAHFVVQMGQRELRKQWTWEPRMAESLILSLLDPNDYVRQMGKSILEQVSNTRGLACGLKFLCSHGASLSAILLGVQHAVKVVQLDSVISKFQTLQHLFFALRKLIEEEDIPNSDLAQKSHDSLTSIKYSSQGGFLIHPVFDSFTARTGPHSSKMDIKSLQNFRYILSEVAWPAIRKCLIEGKGFIHESLCQMTCVRVLEILPVVFKRFGLKNSVDSGRTVDKAYDFLWFNDLMNWGKSSLKVVVVYWKRTVTSILNLLKGSFSDTSASTIRDIESLVSCDSINVDQLSEQVSHLCISLSKEVSGCVGEAKLGPKHLFAESFMGRNSAPDVQTLTLEDTNVQILDSEPTANKIDTQAITVDNADVQILDSVSTTSRQDKSNVVVLSDDEEEKHRMVFLSDDEEEKHSSPSKGVFPKSDSKLHLLDSKEVAPKHGNTAPQIETSKRSTSESKPGLLDIKKVAPIHGKSAPQVDTSKKGFSSDRDLWDAFELKDEPKGRSQSLHKENLDRISGKIPASCKSSGEEDKNKEVKSKGDIHGYSSSDWRNYSKHSFNSKTTIQASKSVVSETSDSILRELVHDNNQNHAESAVKSVRLQLSSLAKSSASGPKRQVIQLETPFRNRYGNLHRLEAGVKRFRPPQLDDWYRRILEVDYFTTVGLTSVGADESHTVGRLKKVPLCFQSPEEYVDVFRPLVLEEFKAQLQSSFLEMSSWDEVYYGKLSVLSVERVDDFHLVRFVHEENDCASSRSFSENDLVLLTKELPQSAAHDVHMIGKVERRERNGKRGTSIILTRFYFLNGSARLNQARRQLTERSKWHANHIISITPQLREFQALSSIKDIPILSAILNPVKESVHYSGLGDLALHKLSQPLQQILKSCFNDSQLQAISVALGLPNSKKGFELSLIQGPPGTGKTQTIMAIVNGLIASAQRTYDGKNSLSGRPKQSDGPCTDKRPKFSQSVAIARAWQDAALAKQLNEDVKRNEKATESSVRRRVLICAQSNAAVDELVSRLSSAGLYASDGEMYKPYLVRVGNAKTVHPNSLPFFIDTLVDQRLNEERLHSSDLKNDSTVIDSSTALRASLEKLVALIRSYEAKRANLRDGHSDLKDRLDDEMHKGDGVKEISDAEFEVKLQKLYEQKKQMFKDISAAQAREKKTSEETRALRNKFRKSILKEAEIVVATLSGCGGDLYGICSESISGHKFGNPPEHTLFDAVVIDEAAQALEPATLIPLQLLKSGGTKCIMVGDPKQLPATVLSNVASKFLYECSMFERLQKAGHPVIMLCEQYRMHPEICRFPSLHFYDNKLLNGEKMSSKSAPFHETKGLGPYMFYDIIDGQELRSKHSGSLSLYNEHEADVAVELLRFFKKRYPSEFVGGRIGIITPYKHQLFLLRSRFSSAFGSSVIANMEFNTVDGFQGREVDILILSTVRADDSGSTANGLNSSTIGFVADVRRMNVALTRAKLSLWILGNARTLQTNKNWAALVKDAKERNLVTSVKRPYEFLFRTTPKDKQTANVPNNRQRESKNVDNFRDTAKSVRQNENKERAELCRNTSSNTSVANADKFSVKRDDIQGRKREVGDENDVRLEKGSSPKSANVENRLSQNAKSAISAPQVIDGKSKGHEPSKKKQNFGNSNLDKRGDIRVDSKRDKDQALKVSSSSVGGSQKSRDANDSRACNPLGTSEDLMAKRKKQREAVDAILSSSLISSKKPGKPTKVLPAKRPPSPTPIVGVSMRPPKAQKGSCMSSDSLMEERRQRHELKSKRANH